MGLLSKALDTVKSVGKSATNFLGSPAGGVAGSIVSSILGSNASGSAADASSEAALQGIAENRRQFDTTLQLQAPMINTGNSARSLLASIMGLSVPGSEFNVGGTTTNGVTTGGTNFTSPASSPMAADEITKRLEAFPGYQFAVDQARKNTLATASALGSGGGNVLSAISDRTAQGIAMPTFENYLNRLGGLSGSGQTASTVAGQAALNTGVNVANGLQNAGDARASGIIGQTGSVIGGIGGVLDALGRKTPGTGGTVGNAAPWANQQNTSNLPWLLGNPTAGMGP